MTIDYALLRILTALEITATIEPVNGKKFSPDEFTALIFGEAEAL